jgi:phenylacetate-CoA ligase
VSVSRTTKLIDLLPESVLAVLVNGMGAVYRANRYTREMRRTLAEWKQIEDLRAERFDAYQLQRFRHIAAVASKAPYYSRVFKEVGFDPHNIDSFDDLKRLPVMEKADLVAHGPDMMVPDFKGRLFKRHSSGTTGQPVAFYQPRQMAYAQGYAMLYQFYSWFGFAALEKRATMAGRYMGHKPNGIVVRNFFENQLLLGVHALSAQSAKRYARALDWFRPDMFQAHPSALLMFKQFAEEAGLNAPSIPLVSYTGENMSEDERRSLSTWMNGAVVFGTYGSGENVTSSSECPALNGYHIHPAVGICELVEINGRSEIIGTSLLNDAMPLLRYRTGDVAEAIATESCPCGCGWPRLLGIQGRADDLVMSSDGKPIAPVVLRTGIAALGVLSLPYSIIQHRQPNELTLLLYGDKADTSEQSIDVVLKYLQSVLGNDCIFRVRFAPSEELLTARAKHRIVIKEKG